MNCRHKNNQSGEASIGLIFGALVVACLIAVVSITLGYINSVQVERARNRHDAVYQYKNQKNPAAVNRQQGGYTVTY